MNFQTRNQHLKNNKSVTIRECLPEDPEKLMMTIKSYLADSEFIPKDPEEFLSTPAEERDRIQAFTDRQNSLLLVAECEGKIIGNIDLTGSQRKTMHHTAVIGMGMLRDWRNCGLGTALMTAAVNWAKENQRLELLWLQVYTENQAGIALYKKFGFTENGIINNFFFNDGKYSDVLTMSRAV